MSVTVDETKTLDLDTSSTDSTPDVDKTTSEYVTSVLDTLIASAETQRKALSELEKNLKTFKKTFSGYVKSNAKNKRTKRPRDPNRAPSGFARPTAISDDLARFLGKEPGTLMARTAVTKGITAYVKEHGLQNPDNQRELITKNGSDEANRLKALLGTDETVTFFNLQRYLKHHFPKTSTDTTSTNTQTSDTSVSEESKTAPTTVRRVVKKRVKVARTGVPVGGR